MKDIIKGRRLARFTLIAGLIGLLLTVACTTTPTSQERANVVAFGNITPLTGPASASEQLGFQGIEDYIRYFNETESIPGVTIKHSWIDTGFVVSNAIGAYHKFVARGVPILHSTHTEALPGIVDKLEKDGVPLITPLQSEYLFYPPGWSYGITPTYAEIFTVLADYIMENWKEERPPKLAFMGSDTEFTWSPVAEGTKYAESIGIEMLPTEIVAHVPLDTTTQLMRLKERGADFIYIQMIPVVAAPILRDAERLGLLDEIQFCGTTYSAGDTLINKAGTATEGYLAPFGTPWWDETEIPGIKLMTDIQMKYHGKVNRDPETFEWVTAAVGCEAIKRAIENVGYENLDGRVVKDALDSMKDFDVYGVATISYTPADHRGSNKIVIYQIKDGKLVRVSDWREAPMLIPD